MGLTDAEISLAYQLFVDRIPDEQEIGFMQANQPDLSALRTTFLNSQEFDQKYTRFKTERDTKRRPILVHLHIPKTAGTTLAEALSKEPLLQPNILVHDLNLQVLREMPVNQRRSLRYVRGHLNMGVGEILGVPYRYLSAIRRPGPRIYSFFQYIMRTASHPSHAELVGKNMTFGSYLEFSQSSMPHRIELDNGQLRRLAGQLNDRTFGREQEFLQLALFNILNPNMIFGYVEHFDSLVRKLHSEGFLSSTDIQSYNISPSSESYEAAVNSLTENQKAIFDNYTAWDTYFYELCLTLLPPN